MPLRTQIALVCSLVSGCSALPKLDETPDTPALDRDDADDAGRSALDRHVANMQRISRAAPWVAGNSARLLIDGPVTYEAVFEAIREARDHVNVETYILAADEVGHKLADLLIEKQQQGVQVNLLYDAVGSLSTPAEFFERMRASGINVCAFNPLLPERGRAANPNQRDHRKQFVIDGRVAISGGINVSSVYSSGSSIGRHKPEPSATEGWRDTNIEVRGPVVAQSQQLFLASWEKQHGAPLAERDYFPRLAEAGNKIVRVIGSSSDDEQSLTYLTLLSAIRESKQRVQITVAYFVPDDEIIDALVQVARRGVAVELLLPSFSDSWTVLQAGRSYYTELLSAGVQIYELRGALLHSKTAVVDGVWSTVGSTNLDWRSFLHNDELNTIVLGEDFGSDMEKMFEVDLRDASRIDRARWAERGVTRRLSERMARLLRYWL